MRNKFSLIYYFFTTISKWTAGLLSNLFCRYEQSIEEIQQFEKSSSDDHSVLKT